MTETFVTLGVEASLRAAAKELALHGVGLLLVTEGESLVGVLSERDVVHAIADGRDPDEVRVADRARGDVLTVRHDESVQAAVSAMIVAGTRHLVVLGRDGRPAGVISARDVLSELAI